MAHSTFRYPKLYQTEELTFISAELYKDNTLLRVNAKDINDVRVTIPNNYVGNPTGEEIVLAPLEAQFDLFLEDATPATSVKAMNEKAVGKKFKVKTSPNPYTDANTLQEVDGVKYSFNCF